MPPMRVCTLTSDLVRDLGSGRSFAFDDGRDVALKGFPGSTRVFELASSRPSRTQLREVPGGHRDQAFLNSIHPLIRTFDRFGE